jgi:hypothetical protein
LEIPGGSLDGVRPDPGASIVISRQIETVGIANNALQPNIVVGESMEEIFESDTCEQI